MTRPVEFVRLPEGRLWHASAFSAWVTACGRVVDAPVVGDGDRSPEYLTGIVPSGAWVCGRCREVLADWLHAVDVAIKADPRNRRAADPLPATDATPPRMSAEAIYAQLLAETDGQPPSEELYVDWMMREHLHPFSSPQPELTTGGAS